MSSGRQIAEALKEIERDGKLTPEDVVEAARKPTSPLHAHFTWDVSEAAHQYHLDQARALIRSVRVVVSTTTRTVKAVGYVRDPEADARESRYVKITAIRTQSDVAREAVVAELQRVSSALERARGIAGVLELDSEIDELLEAATALRRRVSEPT